MSDRNHDSILLDLAETIGALKSQGDMILTEQARAANGRAEMYRKLDELSARSIRSDAKLDGVAETVAGMKPIVADYQQSKYKVVAFLVSATGLAGAIGYFATQIRAFFAPAH